MVRATGILLACCLVTAAGCGGGGRPHATGPADDRYFDGVTFAAVERCVSALGRPVSPRLPPALRHEVVAVRRGGGDAFAVPYERARVAGVYSFFVYISPSAAQVGVRRLKRLVARNLDAGDPVGGVLEARNLVVASFDPLPAPIVRSFRRCAAQ